MFQKSFEGEHTPISPSEPDLGLIRKYSLRDVKAEEVWCGALAACNTKVDRSGERFTKKYLERFRDTLPGKAILGGHDYSSRPLGRIYAAEVLPDGDHWYLKARYYLPADSPVAREVELGIARDCSVGFNAGKRVCDLDGKAWLPRRQGECKEHDPLAWYEDKQCTLTYCDSEAAKAEGMEISLVWQGCQFDAQAIPKGLWTPSGPEFDEYARRFFAMGWNGDQVPQEDGMEIKEAEAEITRLKALTATSDREKALQTELDELKPKAALIADGVKYHAYLTSDVLRMADALDVANNDAEKRTRKQYEAILEAVKAAGAPALEAQRDAIAVAFNARFSQGAGHAGDGNGGENQNQNQKSELLERFAGGLL